MPKIKKIGLVLFVTTILISFSVPAKSQIPEEIVSNLKTGNAKELSGFFNENVELAVLENDNVYSKAQAQQIVNNFFVNNKPDGFEVIHDGGQEGAKYVIGNLSTNNGTFRVYFLLKNNEGSDYIHQLRIEKQ